MLWILSLTVVAVAIDVLRNRFKRDVEVGARVICHRQKGYSFAECAIYAGISEEIAKKHIKRYSTSLLFNIAIDHALLKLQGRNS